MAAAAEPSPRPLEAWVFDRYRYQGSGDVTDTGEVPLQGTPSHQRHTYPLNLSSLVLR